MINLMIIIVNLMINLMYIYKTIYGWWEDAWIIVDGDVRLGPLARTVSGAEV